MVFITCEVRPLALIDAGSRPEVLDETGLRWWTNDRFAIGWKGHCYLPGREGGAPSVAALAAGLATGELARLAPELCGVFGLLVHDRQRGSWQVTVDNAGLYKIFYDRRGCSTRFLDLIDARPYGLRDADHQALVDFLAHGAIYGPGTFVKGVRRLRGTEILVFDAGSGAEPAVRPKAVAATADDSTEIEIVVRHFADLARSLAGKRVSVDLTGGFDSRVVACLLRRHGLAFDGGMSGRGDSRDAQIAARAAKLLGCHLEIVPHDIGDLEDDLPLVFRDGDGLTDVRRFHRDRQNSLARLSNGIEAIVHGGAGELFRDFTFVHDFPRYGSTRIDLARYYLLRACPVAVPKNYLNARGAELLEDAKRNVLMLLEQARGKNNNETFDRFYAFERAPDFYGQYYSNHINMGLDLAAPFLDLALIQAASLIPPWRRFFHGWHRRVLTQHCPTLAALPTAEGFSASSEWRHVVGDLRSFGTAQASRAAKKLTQRLLGKASFHKVGAFAADAPGYMTRLRGTGAFATARERLVEVGILRPDLSREQVRDVHVGRLVTIGMLLGQLDRHA